MGTVHAGNGGRPQAAEEAIAMAEVQAAVEEETGVRTMSFRTSSVFWFDGEDCYWVYTNKGTHVTRHGPYRWRLIAFLVCLIA